MHHSTFSLRWSSPDNDDFIVMLADGLQANRHQATCDQRDVTSRYDVTNQRHLQKNINDLHHWPFLRVIQWSLRLSQDQIVACCLFNAKPLFETVLTYCKLGPCEHISVKLETEYKYLCPWKWNSKCCLLPFCLSLDVLSAQIQETRDPRGPVTGFTDRPEIT